MSHLLQRREFVELLTAGACTLATSGVVMAQDKPAAERKIVVQTYVYKKVGPLEIKLDVHRPDDEVVRPVIVWIHGGALIMGHREGIDGRIKKMAEGGGYILVSIDYRLAPESQLPAIIEDVEDAFAWIRENGPTKFHADVGRLAVAGGSAGGYLTLTAGYRVQPRPTALVSLWGYGDLVGEWYSKPSPHARHHVSKLSAEEARKQVMGPPISDSRDRKGDGGAFYQYCRQQGIWPKEVSGWDPLTEAKKFLPYMPLNNVTREYPPHVAHSRHQGHGRAVSEFRADGGGIQEARR